MGAGGLKVKNGERKYEAKPELEGWAGRGRLKPKNLPLGGYRCFLEQHIFSGHFVPPAVL